MIRTTLRQAGEALRKGIEALRPERRANATALLRAAAARGVEKPPPREDRRKVLRGSSPLAVERTRHASLALRAASPPRRPHVQLAERGVAASGPKATNRAAVAASRIDSLLALEKRSLARVASSTREERERSRQQSPPPKARHTSPRESATKRAAGAAIALAAAPMVVNSSDDEHCNHPMFARPSAERLARQDVRAQMHAGGLSHAPRFAGLGLANLAMGWLVEQSHRRAQAAERPRESPSIAAGSGAAAPASSVANRAQSASAASGVARRGAVRPPVNEPTAPFKRKIYNLRGMFGLANVSAATHQQSHRVLPEKLAHEREQARRARREGKRKASTRAAEQHPSKEKEEEAPLQQSEPIVAVDHPFGDLVQGDRLVLRKGDITSDQWTALSAFLASQPHITSLRLQGVEITAKEADELCRGLKAIRHITFCDNSIGLSEDGLESLVALLLCCELLESTSIIRNSLSDKHVPQILSLLQHHATLTTISLSWNGISDRGAVKLAEALSVLKSSLKHIDLSCNFIGATGGDALMRAVGRRRDLLGHDCAPLRISFDRLPSASRSLPFALRGAAHRVGEVDAFSSCTQSRQNYARLASHYL